MSSACACCCVIRGLRCSYDFAMNLRVVELCRDNLSELRFLVRSSTKCSTHYEECHSEWHGKRGSATYVLVLASMHVLGHDLRFRI